ncbi:MAG: HAD family hydrolase [Acidimicrobiales bacterium]
MSRARFDAILFDAGGVLVLPDPAVLAPLLAPYGADPSVAAHTRAHYAGMAAKSRSEQGEDDWSGYNLAYVRALGVPGHEEAEAAFLLGRTRSSHLWRAPIPESVAALHELAARDACIGVVSNASGQIEATLRRFAVCQVGGGHGAPVRCVVDSGLVGVAKPDPAIFGFALDALGVTAARTAYVGDSVATDVAAARAGGLAPLLLDPFDDWAGSPYERIPSLGVLLSWV